MVQWQGQPDARFVCAGFPVLVYKSGVKIIAANNEVMDRPTFEATVANFTRGGVDRFVIRWRENRRTMVGEWEGDDLRSTGEAGYLQYGRDPAAIARIRPRRSCAPKSPAFLPKPTARSPISSNGETVELDGESVPRCLLFPIYLAASERG